MNIELLRHFTEIVKLKSIAKASERLSLTPPALGKQIRLLEAYYGVSLLKRSPTGVEPTEAGMLLIERVQPLLVRHESLRAELLRFRDKRRLEIGTLPSLASRYLPDKALKLERSGIEAGIVIQPTSEDLVQQLNEHKLDAVVTERPDGTALWSHDLFTEPFYAVVRSDHRLAGQPVVRLADLQEEAFIMYPPNCSIRRCVTGAFRSEGVEPQVKSEVPFGEYLLGYAAAGGGITIVPESIVREMPHPQLRALRIDDPRTCRTICLLAADPETGKRLRPFFK